MALAFAGCCFWRVFDGVNLLSISLLAEAEELGSAMISI